MKNPSEATGDGRKNGSCQGDRQKTLSGLRYQSCLAAVLLFTPWLLTIFLCRSTFWDQPAALPALLPGLAVAVRLQGYLYRHLGANHRRFEEDGLFPTLGAATWITLLRAAALVALTGFLPMAVQPGQGVQITLIWVPGIIYLGIALADLLDGFVARKQGRETELGKGLDIETDAAGLLVASLLAVALGRLPAIYLLVGLAYYPFILGIRRRQRRALPVIALQARPFARIIAGFQMGLVGMALLPIFNPAFLFLAAAIFMTPLLIGFLRDWLVVSCRITTDSDQQTVMDHWARRFCSMPLPLALRLIILAGGGIVVVDSGVYQPSPLWQGALTACCLLAVLGFLGRSACLFLILLLACNLSPFGQSLPALVLFSAATALMLNGTGALSLCAPEEMLLYRGKPPGLMRDPVTMPLKPPDPGKSSALRLWLKKGRRRLFGVLGLALAWQALRGVDWAEVGTMLSGIGPRAILIILGFNLLLLPLMTARWWLLLRTLGSPVSLFSLCAYRIAANAISYLTPGPHFGGEPLAIYLLHHRQGISLPPATTSVAIDRMLEFLASILVMTFCLSLTFTTTTPFAGSEGVILAGSAMFICLLAAFFTGGRPLSRFVFLFRRLRPFPWVSSTAGTLTAVVIQGEDMAESLYRQHPYRFLLANLLSLGHWGGVFAEFWLMSFLLGVPLSFGHLTAVVMVARLAFFTPLPAGIGVLESALPWVTATLGLGSAVGLSLCLIIRSRDLLFSLAGLGLTMKYLTCQGKASIINRISR